MEKQFAVSEVRRLSNRIPRSNDEIADAQEALRAFADLLEAQERAVPVATCGHSSTVEHRASNANVVGSNPIARSNSDAERLAEALRDDEHEWPASLNIRDTKLHDDMGGPGQRIYTTAGRGYKTMKYIRHDLARSAQAQPPAESVTDAIKRAFEHLASIGYPKNALGHYDKDGEWTFSEAVPRDVDAREVSAAFHILEAALAAQENPNG